MVKTNRWGMACLVAGLMIVSGCGKKTPIKTAPPPPPPVTDNTDSSNKNANLKTVVLEFSSEPATIERGQAAMLKWSVSNASAVSIDNGIGSVQSNGNRRITPGESITFTLTAAGPNGSVTARTTVNVTTAPPPPGSGNLNSGRTTIDSAVKTQLNDILFDYDSNAVRADARDILNRDADALKKIFADFPNGSVIIEGHCDDRGSAEYNLGLGDQRASSVKTYLTELGVPGDRLKTVSYGKERPQCSEASEACYQKNRRAHFEAAQ